jgi:hypothetical protein
MDAFVDGVEICTKGVWKMSQDTFSTHVFYTHPTPLPRLAMGSVFLKPVHPVSLGHGWVCSPGGRLVSGAKCFLLPPLPSTFALQKGQIPC